MTFTPIGPWATLQELTSVQMNSIAGTTGDLIYCLDKRGDGYSAVNGGISGRVDVLSTGSLNVVNSSGTSLISLSGSTLQVGALFNNGTLSVTGTTALSGTTTLGGTTTFSGTTTLGGTINVNGTTSYNGATTFNNTLTVAGSNNFNMNGTETLTGATFTADINSLVKIFGALYLGTTSTSSSSYIAVSSDTLILCNPTSHTIQVTLPPPQAGKFIIVKDAFQVASTHNITIVPHASEKIDGVSSETIITNSGFFVYVCDGTDWHSIAFA